eukprot:SAG11_NODE_357_length_10240_cov_4.621142_8_plen_76_part_00
MRDTSVGIFHRKMELAPDVGGTEVPPTMAGKMRNLGPISPDFVVVANTGREYWGTSIYLYLYYTSTTSQALKYVA